MARTWRERHNSESDTKKWALLIVGGNKLISKEKKEKKKTHRTTYRKKRKDGIRVPKRSKSPLAQGRKGKIGSRFTFVVVGWMESTRKRKNPVLKGGGRT